MEVPVSKFKAEALAMVERASRGEEITVTKRGKPMVRLVPIDAPAPLLNSVSFLADEDELLSPAGGAWDAEPAR